MWFPVKHLLVSVICTGFLMSGSPALAFPASATGAAVGGSTGGLGGAPQVTPSPSPSSGATPAATPAPGAALYQSYCSGCHGSVLKKGWSASQIRSAITTNRGGMGFLATLTPSQVQAIADAVQ